MGILLGYRTICEIFLAKFPLLRPLGQAGRSSMTYVKTEDGAVFDRFLFIMFGRGKTGVLKQPKKHDIQRERSESSS